MFMTLVDKALSSINGLPAPPQTESDETCAPCNGNESVFAFANGA